VLIRHLEYLAALARERHFARAAAVCNVTQSTLSAGIKQLEESLDVLIVERGQRFIGLTPEGEKVLVWARHVIADYEGLQQGLHTARDGLVGQLRIGAIPVAQPVVAMLTTPFARHHDRTDIVIRSLSSIEIQRGLDDFSLDVGVTYLDNEPLARVRRLLLYTERYFLLTRHAGDFKGRRTLRWSEAGTLKLCLLTPDMQNRRILDMHFREAGVDIRAAIEANSLITLWSHLRFGEWSSVVPQTVLLLLGRAEGLLAFPLVEPDASHQVGLVASDREPLAPVARALLDVAKELDLNRAIERELGEVMAAD
jgi:DNA-binding transcriptional LysR family regulator